MGQASAAMKGLESRVANSMGLAGDAGEPLLLVLALLNAAELSWLLGRYEVMVTCVMVVSIVVYYSPCNEIWSRGRLNLKCISRPP